MSPCLSALSILLQTQLSTFPCSLASQEVQPMGGIGRQLWRFQEGRNQGSSFSLSLSIFLFLGQHFSAVAMSCVAQLLEQAPAVVPDRSQFSFCHAKSKTQSSDLILVEFSPLSPLLSLSKAPSFVARSDTMFYNLVSASTFPSLSGILNIAARLILLIQSQIMSLY